MMAAFAKVDLDRLDARLQRLVAQLGRHVDPGTATAGALVDALVSDGSAEAAPPVPPSSSEPLDLPIDALLAALAPAVLDEARDVSLAGLPVAIGTPHAAEALHAVRIAAKKLRYTLEIVAPYLGDGGPAVVKRLRAVQEKLGDFHDDCVLDDTLRPAFERALQRGRPLLAAELRTLRTSRRRALLRDERAVRAGLAKLRDEDFVGIVADTLRAAGVTLPEPEPVAVEIAAAQAGT
jgi:hypothetical protein